MQTQTISRTARYYIHQSDNTNAHTCTTHITHPHTHIHTCTQTEGQDVHMHTSTNTHIKRTSIHTTDQSWMYLCADVEWQVQMSSNTIACKMNHHNTKCKPLYTDKAKACTNRSVQTICKGCILVPVGFGYNSLLQFTDFTAFCFISVLCIK